MTTLLCLISFTQLCKIQPYHCTHPFRLYEYMAHYLRMLLWIQLQAVLSFSESYCCDHSCTYSLVHRDTCFIQNTRSENSGSQCISIFILILLLENIFQNAYIQTLYVSFQCSTFSPTGGII